MSTPALDVGAGRLDGAATHNKVERRVEVDPSLDARRSLHHVEQAGEKPRAFKDLKALPAAQHRRVVTKIEVLQHDLAGDVKKLTNFTPEYRLRVGDYRVLFEVEGNTVVVYRVLHRREAY